MVGPTSHNALYTCMYDGLNHPVGQVYSSQIGWLCPEHLAQHELEVQGN